MQGTTQQVKSCEVCGNASIATVLDLGLHPMCDDLVPIGDARACHEYPIEILFCTECRTAHQRFQVPKHDLFPVEYHYRSRFTADVLKGMAGLVDSCAERFGSLEGKLALDVGCNDGSLLDFFRQHGARTVGIEPTGAAGDAAQKGHAIYADFLSEETAGRVVAEHGQPDFITFTNVFAHIEDLGAVLRSLRILMSPTTVLVVENHYLGAVLDGNQFDTFYHEHPRTYSFTSFVRIAQSLAVNLIDVEFPSRYGGNIRVFMGNAVAAPLPRLQAVDRTALLERESRFFDDFATLRASVGRWKASKARELAALVASGGPLRAKAFPARAAILIRLLDLDVTSIQAVHEKPGSLKIGHYVPGTRIPIVSDDELFAASSYAAPLLNLAWHIPVEIRAYLKADGFKGTVIDVVSARDFQADAVVAGA